MALDPIIGEMTTNISDITKDYEIETWFPLYPPSAKGQKADQKTAEICLILGVNEYNIVASSEFKKISTLLHDFQNNLTVDIVETISRSPISIDLKKFASTFLDLFQSTGTANDWIIALSEREVSRTGTTENDSNGGRQPLSITPIDINLLFRGNSLFTKSLDFHMKRIGAEFIQSTLGDFLQKIADENEFLDIDPMKVDYYRASHSDALSNTDYCAKLNDLMEDVWRRIRDSAGRCPNDIKRIFAAIRQQVDKRFEQSLSLTARYAGISGIVFLRFYCPAILYPKLFGLLRDHPPPYAQRTLTLTAKVLQGLANQTPFGTKEPWMRPMNKFVKAHIDEVKQFLDVLCQLDSETSSVASSSFNLKDKISSALPDFSVAKVSHEEELDSPTFVNQQLPSVAHQIPMKIVSRLPQAFKDDVPTLPYLINQSVIYSDVVTYWLSWYESQVDQGKQAKQKPLDNILSHMQVQEVDTPTMTLPPQMDEGAIAGAFKLHGPLLEFHEECLRIRDLVRSVKAKCAVPEVPTEMDDSTWEHYFDALIKMDDRPSLMDAFIAAGHPQQLSVNTVDSTACTSGYSDSRDASNENSPDDTGNSHSDTPWSSEMLEESPKEIEGASIKHRISLRSMIRPSMSFSSPYNSQAREMHDTSSNTRKPHTSSKLANLYRILGGKKP